MKKRAVTIAELAVGLLLISLLVGAISNVIRHVRAMFMRGTVDLQNLQEGRLAINYLRRDFSCACPRFSASDDSTMLEKTRRLPILPGNDSIDGKKTASIQIGDNGIQFYRFSFETTDLDPLPTIELVKYSYDPGNRILTRTSPSRMVEFKGIKGISFRVYSHETNPKIPMLWVKLEIQDEEAGKDLGKPLEITTSLSSSFLESEVNYPYWYFRAFQE